MRIENIRIRNYRLFRCLELRDLSQLTFVVGANGSGKSSLFDIFTFLRDALIHNVDVAVARRGGFSELVSRGSDGPIGITIQFRERSGHLLAYVLEITRDSQNGRGVVARELLRCRRGKSTRPRYLVDFNRGEGYAIADESVAGQGDVEQQREEFKLEDPSVLAINGLGQIERFRIVSEFRKLIEAWHVSDFQISDARPSIEAGYSEHLSATGDNVAQVAHHLYQHHRACLDRVVRAMSARVPGVSGVEAKLTEDGRLALRFWDNSFQAPFTARSVSGGTLKMFAYLLLLYDPKPHPLLTVEEPEGQIHPGLLPELVEEFRDYARRGGQVFMSTHSPLLLNGAMPNEVYCLTKEHGFTKARRASDHRQLERLMKEGDQLGTLWNQGLLEGPHAR